MCVWGGVRPTPSRRKHDGRTAKRGVHGIFRDAGRSGQDHKAAVLKRGNELLEQNGRDGARHEFSEAIGHGHRDGHRLQPTGGWGSCPTNHAADSPLAQTPTRGKKEYISQKPNAEAPRPASASADEPCIVRGCTTPSATDSKYCVWHGEPTESRGKGGGNA